MLKKFFQQINRITFFGIQEHDSYLDTFRKRVLNRTFFIVAVTCLILLLEAILLGTKTNNAVPIIVGLISTGSLAFTYFNQFKIASAILCILFPTLFLGTIILYGDQLKLDYTISFFIVLVLTLYDDKRLLILNISYLILLQIASFYYTSNYTSVYAEYVNFQDSLIILTFTTLGLFILVFQFMRATKEFQDQQKELNQHLDTQNKELEQIIKEKIALNKNLLEKTRDLQQSNDFLESYTYITSHDLKTPMRTIFSFSDLLNKKLKDSKDEDIKDYLKFIRTGVLQFNAIIEGIIENAQNNRSTLQMEKINCMDIMQQLESRLRYTLEVKKGQLYYQALPVIWADKQKITKVFENLIDNGFKYNRSETPKVRIMYREDPEVHEFTVADNGMGIQAVYSEDIFKMFKKLHAQEEFTGSGVGLALCKKIVELHRGEIWLESGLELGSAFKFTIPKMEYPTKKDSEFSG